jgi:hypothetical protein
MSSRHARQIGLIDRRFHVERRQPIDAIDRPRGQPRFDLIFQRRLRQRFIDRQHGHATLL